MFSSNTFAESVEFVEGEESSEFVDIVENIGVSTVQPSVSEVSVENGMVSPYSTSTPTERWNLANKGQYDFSGSAGHSTLFSNYLFTGKNKVTIYVENNHPTATLTVKLRDLKSWFNFSVWSENVKPGKSVEKSVDVDSSKDYFLQFEAPSRFSGYIR